MVDHNVLRWLKSHDTPHFDHFPHVMAYNIRTTETPSLETTAIKSTFLTTANNVIAILTALHIIAVAGVACAIVVSANNSLRKGPGQPHARTSATLCSQEQLTPCATHSPPVPPTHPLYHPLTPCTTHSPPVLHRHPLYHTLTPCATPPPLCHTHPLYYKLTRARLLWPTLYADLSSHLCVTLTPVLLRISLHWHSPQLQVPATCPEHCSPLSPTLHKTGQDRTAGPVLKAH